MIDFLKRHIELAVILIIWMLLGCYTEFEPYPTTFLIPLCVLLFKYKNQYQFMYFGFLFMLAMSDNWSYSMSWTKDSRNIYMLLLSVFFFLDRKHFNYPNKLYFAFIPFLIWTVLVATRNEDMSNAFQKSLSYGLILIIIPVYFQKLIAENGERFLRDIVFFVAWLLVIGFLYIPVRYDLVFLMDRYRGVLGNPNGIGTFSFVFTTFFYILNEKFPKLFTKNERIFIYILIFVSLILSQSRNGLTSILIFFLFIRFYRYSAFAGFALFIILLVGFQIVSQNLTDIVRGLGLGEALRVDSIENGSGRLVAWKFAWVHIQDNFFIGKGFDYDAQLFVKNKRMLSMLGHNGGIHNVFLGLWLCFGLVGVILFYQALLRTFFKLARKSALAIPLLYGTLFSTSYEAWLMGSINPFTVYFLQSLVLLSYETYQANATAVSSSTAEKGLVSV